MNKVGLWQIVEGNPRKIQEAGIDLEQQLEQWIESDPGLKLWGIRRFKLPQHLASARDLLER